MPSDTIVYYECDESDPMEFVWVGFCGHWAKQIIAGAELSEKTCVADIVDLPVIEALAEQIVQTIAKDSSYIAMQPCFYNLLMELMKARGYSPLRKKEAKIEEERDLDSKIAEILHLIENNYSENICVNNLAEQLNISRAYLSRRFKKLTGQTIKEYVKEVRIGHAKNLLAQSTKTMTEIARECGYSTDKFFSRTFKQIVGCTPGEWRRMMS